MISKGFKNVRIYTGADESFFISAADDEKGQNGRANVENSGPPDV